MNIKSQIQAIVWKISVEIGDKINEGQEVIILESMKMEIPIISDITGIVESILVEEGDTINAVSYTHLTLPTKA